MSIQLRTKFINNGIPYDKLDEEMIDIIDVFNFDLGIKTKYCCYGHESNELTYIMFDDYVSDEQIYNLAEKVFLEYGYIFSFKKWLRGVNGKILENWMFEIPAKFKEPNDPMKKESLDYITNVLRKVNKV
jgi:hypothetical protein